MKTLNNSLAKRLKEQRLECDMTQDQLAKKTGLFQVTISQYEAGIVLPELKTFMKLCKALKASADHLLFGK